MSGLIQNPSMAQLQRYKVEIRNSVFRAVSDVERARTETRGRKSILSTAMLLDRIFYVCKTGCSWRNLEVVGASAKTVYHHFNRWSKLRVFERAFAIMRATYLNLPKVALLEDCSFVKNRYGQDVLGRSPVDRGRKATKVSLLADERGAPLHVCFHRGNRADCQTLHHLLNAAASSMGPLRNHGELLADKGYDSALCRSACAAHALLQRIPQRRTPHDRAMNGRRVKIEHVFGHIDHCRRVELRYDSKMFSFRSFHALACMKVLSQVMWSPSRPHLVP